MKELIKKISGVRWVSSLLFLIALFVLRIYAACDRDLLHHHDR